MIKDYIRTNSVDKNFWTSGSDSAQEGSFVWTSTGEQVMFTDWHTEEPNNMNGVEDTVGFYYKSNVLKWNDIHSTLSDVYAICEEEI
ncbi:hypothetical protein B566_EDAN015076 [Ephemera danica]|nr:hypothetical protein B566_EDAN015076 [Ephemera danica]